MKLVLLPGMDGTGALFDDFLSACGDIEHLIIPLPQSGPQDYFSLAAQIKEKLPNQDFLLLAESFSGPIAAQLAFDAIPHLKGVVFVGSFLSAPNKLMLLFARLLPVKWLFKLPFNEFALRNLMLGENANAALIEKFRTTVASVPKATLNTRIQSMQRLRLPEGSSTQIPAFYIGGDSDRLVKSSKVAEFRQRFPKLEHYILEGPHFLMQANPAACRHQVINIRSRLNRLYQLGEAG